MKQREGDKVGVGVIGCGAVAEFHHLPAIALSEGAHAAALVDLDPERAARLARRFGAATTATDYRQVLDQIEAAVVALPNHLHAPVTIDLLRRGIHVLVEKPMAMNGAEADDMIAAADSSGAMLAVGLEFRFFEACRWVRRLLRTGFIGPLRSFDVRVGVVPQGPWASEFLVRPETAGGGVLMDFGPHLLDLLLWWLGDWSEVDYRDDALGGLEADCLLHLTLRSGVTGTVEISRTRTLRNVCVLEGERAVLEVGMWDPDPEIRLRPHEEALPLAGHVRPAEAVGLTFTDVFVRQVDDFTGAIREGRPPFVDGREGRRSLALIDACYACRRPLDLPWSLPLVSRRAAS